MKTIIRSRSVKFVGAILSILGIGVVVAMSAQTAIAQTADTLEGTGTSDINPNSSNGNGLDMFDLLHRAQQGTIRSQDEFLRDQQETIGEAAADFRARQQEALQQQQQPEIPTSSETPQN